MDKNKGRFILLKNGKTQVLVDRIGAQIVAIDVDGQQISFSGATDPLFEVDTQWAKTAPVLFPNPGPVGKENEKYGVLPRDGKDTTYYHNGGVYKIGQHGFAQNTEFVVQGFDGKSCVLSIDADEETVKHYPYDFRFYVVIDIDENGQINYKSAVNNLDNKPILAGQGWHPAFKLHADPRCYKVVFRNLEKDESCEAEEGVLYDVYEPFIKANKSKGFGGIKSADVEIVYVDPVTNKQTTYLTMHTDSPNIIIWSRDKDYEEAHGHEYFLAIEPWNTTPRQIQKLTTQDKTPSIEGARIVGVGEVDELNASVKVNPEYIAMLESQAEFGK